MNQLEVETRLDWATKVAHKVGEMLVGNFRTGVKAQRKGSGIVTEIDRRAEDIIVGELDSAFPQDGLMSEEGAGRESKSGYRWIVDPMDGTTNFVNGLEYFGTSYACLDDEGPVLSVVHAPFFKETYTSARGQGARLGEGRIAPSGVSKLSDALFLLNKAYHPPALIWETAGNLLASIRAFRVLGSVSVDLVQVAAGRVGGIVLWPADPWDFVSSALILEESGAGIVYFQLGEEPLLEGAGRSVKTYDKPPSWDERCGLMAAAPGVFDQALAAFLV